MRKRFRVVNVRRAKSPDHWGVQQLMGYTDGKPSYRLVRRFWSKAHAVAFSALSELGLADDAVDPSASNPGTPTPRD